MLDVPRRLDNTPAAVSYSGMPDAFNLDLSQRKAIYIPYPQAVPLVYTIDKEHCTYFKKGKCRICEKVCKNEAVDFNQEDEIIKLGTGAVILAGALRPLMREINPNMATDVGPMSSPVWNSSAYFRRPVLFRAASGVSPTAPPRSKSPGFNVLGPATVISEKITVLRFAVCPPRNKL